MNKTYLLGLLFLVACGGSEQKIREVVALEATAEIGVWRQSDPGFKPDQINLRRGSVLEGGAQIWYAFLPLDHFHPYTLLQKGSEVVGLGGFQNPEIHRAAELLKRTPRDGRAVLAFSRELAMLADPNGADRFVFPGAPAPEDSVVLHAWHTSASEFPWPRDTVTLLEGGARLGRVMMLSQESRSYEQRWRPAVYTFVFSREGRLLSWFRRVGETSIPLRGDRNELAKPGGP